MTDSLSECVRVRVRVCVHVYYARILTPTTAIARVVQQQ
jgi:hypothetical protein